MAPLEQGSCTKKKECYNKVKEPNTNRIVKFRSEEIGAGFVNWTEATQAESDAFELNNAQDLKIAQLKKNRAEKAEFSTVEYNSKTYSNSQNARNVITGRIAITTNASPARFYQTYPVVEIVHLSRPDFVAIANLIDENESSLRAAEIGLINEIKACTAISEIDLIKIEF